jgi:DNA-binding CsgD family transcriptional regulator
MPSILQIQIAESQFISISTLKTHMNNIFKKVPENFKLELKKMARRKKVDFFK